MVGRISDSAMEATNIIVNNLVAVFIILIFPDYSKTYTFEKDAADSAARRRGSAGCAGADAAP
jgi:hypothetical protein